jgi:hypothetical protein
MRSNRPPKDYAPISSIQLLKILTPISIGESVHVIECIEMPYHRILNGEPGPDIETLDLSKLTVTYGYKCLTYIREIVLPNPVSEELSTLLDLYCLGKLCW